MPSRLFLLEDEDHLAFALTFNLEKAGYTVVAARNLAEARECLPAADSELLIFDVMLPDGSGFDLCRELRAAGDLTPVLFLTAKGTPDDIVMGLDAGGDDYITKPFALDELLARIAAILRRRRWDGSSDGELSAPQVMTSYTFAGNRVDFVSHEATAGDKTLTLTALELKLLRYFFKREGEVVTREKLLTEVWEVSSETNTRTVDNFLVRLRRAFEDDPSSPRHFLTVRGVGYRFVATPPA